MSHGDGMAETAYRSASWMFVQHNKRWFHGWAFGLQFYIGREFCLTRQLKLCLISASMRWARRVRGGENNRRSPSNINGQMRFFFLSTVDALSRYGQITNGDEIYLYLSDVFWRQILNALLLKRRSEANAKLFYGYWFFLFIALIFRLKLMVFCQ